MFQTDLELDAPMPDAVVNLELIALQQAQLLTGINSLREDMAVMMEIMRRLDLRVGSLETVVHSIGTQLTEMHVYNRRTAERVRALEERQ